MLAFTNCRIHRPDFLVDNRKYKLCYLVTCSFNLIIRVLSYQWRCSWNFCLLRIHSRYRIVVDRHLSVHLYFLSKCGSFCLNLAFKLIDLTNHSVIALLTRLASQRPSTLAAPSSPPPTASLDGGTTQRARKT